MKRLVNIFTLMFVVSALVLLFSACTNSGARDNTETVQSTAETTTSSSNAVYYDKNGTAYDSEENVNYYDRDGNVYHYMMVEDYLPDYVNEKTGEHINGFECYIDENGFFCHISDNKVLSRVENSVDTYEDESGNKYYDISTVSWDENGNMIHSNFVTGK